MTKDVIISIKGLQFIEEEDKDPEPVEIVTMGEHYLRNGNHYLTYEEVLEGTTHKIKNYIKMNEKSLEVRKKGAVNVQMVFETNKKNITYYSTPFGTLQMGISATAINMEEQENDIQMNVEYAMEMNYEYVADCKIEIRVQSKGEHISLYSGK